MAIVTKRRARKLLANGNVSGISRYPNGVGGIEGHCPCTGFTVGDITMIFTDAELFEALITAEFAVSQLRQALQDVLDEQDENPTGLAALAAH